MEEASPKLLWVCYKLGRRAPGRDRAITWGRPRHRSRGGGLSSLFGGGVQSSLSGSSVVEKNLDRLTLFVSAVWVISIVGIGLLIKIG